MAQAFIPFAQLNSIDLKKGPWLPFTSFKDGSYDKLLSCYQTYTVGDATGKALEIASVTNLKLLVIGSETRMLLDFGPSGLWGSSFGT